MSKEYIPKDELEQALRKEAAPLLHYYKRYLCVSNVVNELIGVVQRFPAADVVEVSRCENCIHRGKEDCPMRYGCECGDFCSRGKPREDKTKECYDVHNAHWIKESELCYDPDASCFYAEYSCSYCGTWVDDHHGLPEYCPECGKKMKSPLPESPKETNNE